MAAERANAMSPDADARSVRKGDIPDTLRRRYLTDTRGGPGVGFFTDTTVTVAAFRDHGRRLTATHTHPQVVRDLIAVAKHRDWTVVKVQGAPEFRREVWLSGSLAGLEVRGYRATERDLQDLGRRKERQSERSAHLPGSLDVSAAADRKAQEAPGVQARLKIVEAVVRGRIVEPADQARILSAARERLASWLERGARFPTPVRAPGHDRTR
jgi:hypothetical protein